MDVGVAHPAIKNLDYYIVIARFLALEFKRLEVTVRVLCRVADCFNHVHCHPTCASGARESQIAQQGRNRLFASELTGLLRTDPAPFQRTLS